MKPYTRANLYAEIAKRDRRIAKLERDRMFARSLLRPHAEALYRVAMRWFVKREHRLQNPSAYPIKTLVSMSSALDSSLALLARACERALKGEK